MKFKAIHLRPAWVVLGLVGVTACGPQTSSTVRMTGRPVDVVFGDKATPTPAPPMAIAPGANFQPHFPSIIEPQIPDFDLPPVRQPVVLPTATPTPCPTEALPGVKEIAPPRITKRPAPATYVYARTGRAQRTLPTSGEIRLDELVTREYSASRPADATLDGPGSFLFDVKETTRTATVVNTYLVSPNGGGVNSAITAGLYLYRIESTTTGGNSTDVFAPTQPLVLMPFPAAETATWHTAATDPRSQVTMELDGLFRGKKRINFCGQGVDTWDIHLTGHIAGPGKVVNVSSLDFTIGTQYGGVFLTDGLTQDGTDTDGQYTSTETTAITGEPHEGA